MMLGDYY